jgi:hypothetical protein
MGCRVERVGDGGTLIVFRVTGRIQRAHIQMLREVLERESGRLVLDLEEGTLVDREVVRFLHFLRRSGSSSNMSRIVSESGSPKSNGNQSAEESREMRSAARAEGEEKNEFEHGCGEGQLEGHTSGN